MSFGVRPRYRTFIIAMNLEDQVTEGHVVCIQSVRQNADLHELTLSVVGDPTFHKVLRLVKFTGVANYSEQWDEEAERTGLHSLIGLEEYQENGRVRYVVALDEVEITFTSIDEPVVIELQ